MAFLKKNKTEDHGEHKEQTTNDHRPSDQVEVEPPPLRLDTDAGPSRSTTITPDKCIAHLKFLTALADLRDQVAHRDGLFGLRDSEAGKFDCDTADEARARIREKRWAVYTARAVKRFTFWWEKVVPSGHRPKLDDLGKREYSHIVLCETEMAWSRESMPPLDVIMVLHAYMLNPRDFLEDCIRYGKMHLWASEFPWIILNTCINDETLEYHPGRAAEACFEQRTGLCWDNLDDPPDTSVNCPRCGQSVSVPWTRGDMSTTSSLEKAYEHFNGFADEAFEAPCPVCHYTINHERLRLAKLHDDINSLLTYKLPMPGTYFNQYGIPKFEKDPYQDRFSFPNKLVEVLGPSLFRDTDAKQNEYMHETINGLSKTLSIHVNEKHVMRRIRGTKFALIPCLQEKMALRRMISRYCDNHTPFALDLATAVLRQGNFVQKMDTIDWLHSPTLQATMERSINKYQIFVRVMAKNPKRMAVPTLDVDLVWHTHQLCPRRYFEYTTSQTRDLGDRVRGEIFINHNDRVGDVQLGDGFGWTSRKFTKETGGRGVYDECLCWYCGVLRLSGAEFDGAGNFRRTSIMRVREVVAYLRYQLGILPHSGRDSSLDAVRSESGMSSSSSLHDIETAKLRSNDIKERRRSEKRKRQNGNSRDGVDSAVKPAESQGQQECLAWQ